VRRALVALSLCVVVWRFEQPVGQTVQGFVNTVDVEACPGYPDGTWMLRATETMRDGTTGRQVGATRTRIFTQHELAEASRKPGAPAQEPGRHGHTQEEH